MKMSAATSPTNTAAIASIVSMMRSITLRFTDHPSPCFSPLIQPLPRGRGARTEESKASLVLSDARLKGLVDLIGIAAGLGDGVGPLLLQWLDGGLPGFDLVRRQFIDLVTRR